MATSQNVRSGHSTSMNDRKAQLTCHSMKSLRRDSPDVRMSRSTGGLSCRVRRHWLSRLGVISVLESAPDARPPCSPESAQSSSSVDLHGNNQREFECVRLGFMQRRSFAFITEMLSNQVKKLQVQI